MTCTYLDQALGGEFAQQRGAGGADAARSGGAAGETGGHRRGPLAAVAAAEDRDGAALQPAAR